MASPWRSQIGEIRDRFKMKTFFREHYVFDQKLTKPRQIQSEDLFFL